MIGAAFSIFTFEVAPKEIKWSVSSEVGNLSSVQSTDLIKCSSFKFVNEEVSRGCVAKDENCKDVNDVKANSDSSFKRDIPVLLRCKEVQPKSWLTSFTQSQSQRSI